MAKQETTNTQPKAKRTMDEIFQSQFAKRKTTGNEQLDKALTQMVLDLRAKKATPVRKGDTDFEVNFGKVTAKVGKVPFGKNKRVQMEVAGLQVTGSYAQWVYKLANQQTRVAKAKAPAFDTEKVEAIAELLALD
jgi:hypothetical protein